jgi:RNA polymerase sigma factor (TIGR02999 family)
MLESGVKGLYPGCMPNVTQILSSVRQGDAAAAEQLLPLVYEELRRLASARLAREKPGQTLQATALVHDAYLRLVDVKQAQHWSSRGHFFGAAAEAMRRIMIEKARRKKAREIDNQPPFPIDRLELSMPIPGDDLLALNEALDRLQQRDSASAELVKLRFFAGLTVPEAAEALEIPLRTAQRNWTYARTWLHRELTKGDIGDAG